MSLLYLNWNYTHKCKFSCAHCYSRAPKYTDELSTEQYQQVVSKIVDLPVFSVGFGGGEPLDRKDFLLIVSELSSKGIHTHFTTNGWNIDEDKADRIKQSGVDRVTVSFDSYEPEVHDTIRGKKGSFESAVLAVRLLSSIGVETWLSITLSKSNISKIDKLIELGKSLNASGINFKVIRPSGNASILKESLVPSANEVKLARSAVEKETSIHANMYGPEDSDGCNCGRTTLTIRPDGTVAFCPYSESVVGSILESDLHHLHSKAQKYLGTGCHGQQGSNWPLGSSNVGKSVENKYVEKIRNKDVIAIHAI